jgi:diguanylate cyclase (GGDEF)-like protein
VLYRLVLAAPSGAEGDDLEAAARSFAVATGSMAVLARRMSSLRQVVSAVAGEEGLDRARVAAALDRATVAATQAALAQLEGAALTDPLTECGNRRALEMAAPAALALANRTGKPLSVVALDLDGLKVLNDTHGHAVGDRALAGLSAAARAALRATDQLFRIGGDEFVVLLPLAGEAHVADLVRRMELFNAPRFSWGAATMPADGTDLEALLRVADARLYESRRVAGYQRRPGVAAPPAGALAAIAHHWARAAVVAACSMAVVAVLAFVLGPSAPPRADWDRRPCPPLATAPVAARERATPPAVGPAPPRPWPAGDRARTRPPRPPLAPAAAAAAAAAVAAGPPRPPRLRFPPPRSRSPPRRSPLRAPPRLRRSAVFSTASSSSAGGVRQ